MKSLTSMPHLIRPVISRAQAGLLNNLSGFIDHAAIAILERLSIDIGYYPIKKITRKTKKLNREIYRCQWIDERIIHFALIQPRAVCVEIDGGLSTRFHRVSQQLEYPQFSFISINNPSTHDYIQHIFPKTDNYRLVKKTSTLNDWHHEIKPSISQPYILVFGEGKSINDPKAVDSIVLTAQRCLKEAATSIDILICHNIEGFQNNIAKSYPSIQIISNDNEPGDEVHAWRSAINFISGVFRRKSHQNTTGGKDTKSHLRIT